MPDHPPLSRTFELEAEEGAGPQRAGSELLYVVLEASRPAAGGARFDVSGLEEILIGRGTERALGPHPEGGDTRRCLRLPDKLVSSQHAKIVRKRGELFFQDLGSRNGSRLDGKRVRLAPLPGRALLEIGGSFLLFDGHGAGTVPDVDADRLAPMPLGLSTLVPSFEAALADLRPLAATTVPILVLGETGTGKELIARAVHQLSGRPGAFVPVNCGALPEALVESLLFGHARGAFSGAAKDEIGLVRASHRGTLFLDEIGELPKASQAKLLRVLQEREVLPVGGTTPIAVDLRVVAATLQDVESPEQSILRGDLLARLAGFTLRVPPLRERLADLGVVAAGILGQLDPPRLDLELTPAAGRALLAHSWPFNARELHQALSVGAVLAAGGTLDVAQLPAAIRGGGDRPSSLPEGPPPRPSPTAPGVERAGQPTDEDEENERAAQELRDRLVGLLTEHAGNVSEIARIVGRSRMQVHRWMKRFELDPAAFRR